MPRLSFLLVVLGGCCAGCSQPNALPTEPEPAPPSVPVVDPSPSIEVKPEEKKPTIPETRPVISVGQSLDQALTVLATAKAENISNGVGIFMPVPTDGSPRHECRWFILRDGTCLRVLLRTEGCQNKLS